MSPGDWDYCPWQHLGDLDGVELRYHDDGQPGWVDFDDRVISLLRGMSGSRRRTTLAHELVHLERGPVRLGATATAEEYLVESATALRLIPAPILGRLSELVARHGHEAATSFLDIDDSLLRTALTLLDATIPVRPPPTTGLRLARR